MQGPGPWFTAVFIAVLINLGVLGLLPKLLDREAGTLQGITDSHKVDFLKIRASAQLKKKRPQHPVRKMVRKPNPIAPPNIARPLTKELILPFKINARLPEDIGFSHLPPIDPVVVRGVGINGIFNQDDLDSPLVPVAQVPPVYPLRARRQGIEGWVTVKFLVTADGQIQSVSILDSKPPRVFDKSVRRCVNAWRFRPGMVAGQPVRTWVETTIKFKLE